MELFSKEFQNTSKTILDSVKPFLGTNMKSRGPLADIIKKRPDVLIFEVTNDNRNSIKSKITNAINHLNEERK